MTTAASSDARPAVVPVVNYFVPEASSPHLLAWVCDSCDARYLERRNGCGRCGGTAFGRLAVSGSGTVKTYTVVWRNAPNVTTPFVSCVVDLGGGLLVKSNLVGIDPASVNPDVLDKSVELAATELGTDAAGTVAHTFVFRLTNEATR
ncbi:OB-fold domain-containing protein [Nocardia sp. NBC_01377]|uniref:Zn-ribbon domain-containing OB-fold protein n=1 Tax=Nocardia sp. NBC_01377 TaxID=2903595 RepID=UPI0032544AE7